jgi:hypothetical protein
LPVAARAQSSPRDRINVLLWTNACQPSIIVSTTTNVGAGMTGTQFKLFLMMVLQLAIWGSWALQIFGYVGGLGFTPFQQSMILNAFPVGAILAMFFTTQFADRHFAAEKTLAFSHLVGGSAMIGLYYVHDFWPFLILMYIHCLFYVPTFSITNSIAFAHLKDAKDEFGVVRMGGTIGWILVAWPFLLILVDYSKVPDMGQVGFVKWLEAALGTPLEGAAYIKGASSMFLVAGGISFVLAAFSLTLPHTPPKKGESLAWLEAMKLLAVPFVLVLWIVTLIDSTVHRRAEELRIQDDDDRRRSRSRRAIPRFRLLSGKQTFRRSSQRPPRHLLCLLLRGRLYLRRTGFPERRTFKRSRAVQSDDLRHRPADRLFRLPDADGSVHDDPDRRRRFEEGRRLPKFVPLACRRRGGGSDLSRAVLPSAAIA